jgi:hypothetical protein
MNTFKCKTTICFCLCNKCKSRIIWQTELPEKPREYTYLSCNNETLLLQTSLSTYCLRSNSLLCSDPVLIPLIAARRSAHCWLVDVLDYAPPPQSPPPNRGAHPILFFAYITGVSKYPNKVEDCNSAHAMKEQRSNLIRGLQGQYSNYRYTSAPVCPT